MNETTFSLNSSASSDYGAIVIGGGFYGARLASMLRRRGLRVLLVERESSLLARASLRNQARVHNGYHYPRSILTSMRSRLNYRRFLDEYGDCVHAGFTHYYAVARGMSKVTAGQFVEFCRRIEAPLAPAPAHVANLFDASRIEAVFEVEECAFDGAALGARMTRELADAGVDVLLETEAVSVNSTRGGVEVTLRHSSDPAGPPGHRSTGRAVNADLALNCTYSRLNHVLAASDAEPIPAKHELTELALVEPPEALGGAAVTVMDGPFFSLMPYPSRGLYTLSHVRYTPHYHWHDRPNQPDRRSAHDARRVAVRAHGARRDALPSRHARDAVRRFALGGQDRHAAQREGRQPPDPAAPLRRAPGADHGARREDRQRVRRRRRTARGARPAARAASSTPHPDRCPPTP